MTGPPLTDTPRSVPGEQTNRRRFLAGVGVAGTTLLAGCLGDDDSGTDSGNPDDEDADGADDSSDDGADDANDGGPDNGSDGGADDDDDSGDDDSGDDDSGDDDGVEDDPATLEQRALEFMELQGQEAFEAVYDRLDEAAAGQVSVEDLESGWEQVLLGSGAFGSVQDAEYQRVESGVAVVSVEVAFTQVRNVFNVYLTDGGVRGSEVVEQEQYDWDPPSYADSSAFSETTVTLDATESCELGGTLSVPAGEGSVPGVVIVHGSGAVDRDGTFGPNRPYKELAWGLASRGIAVLRYDKRTFACDVALSDLTIDDVVTNDALTALDRLRAHERVDAGRVFVVGHSLGGGLAPRIAVRDGGLAGAVMLAPGPARPIVDAIVEQFEHLLDQQDLTEAEREEALADVVADAETVRSGNIGEDEVLFGLGGQEYFETLSEYDGPATATGLDIPLLLAQGERDYQVTPDGDFAIWQDTLSGLSNVSFRRYEDLNHLFQQSNGPMTNTEYYEPGAVLDGRVVEDIAEFIGNN
jgi:dienelactone hydrolase